MNEYCRPLMSFNLCIIANRRTVSQELLNIFAHRHAVTHKLNIINYSQSIDFNDPKKHIPSSDESHFTSWQSEFDRHLHCDMCHRPITSTHENRG